MSTSLQDKAQIHRERFESDCRFLGERGEYDHINIRAGEQMAARHDYLLKLVCLEAGEHVAEQLEQELDEQVRPDEIGEEGCAAYYEARTALADLDAEADRLGYLLIILHRFARNAARGCRTQTIRRAFA